MIQKKKFSDALTANKQVVEELLEGKFVQFRAATGDCNNAVDTGIYTAKNSENAPTSGLGFLAVRNLGYTILQIFIAYGGVLYIRSSLWGLNEKTWQPWKQYEYVK